MIDIFNDVLLARANGYNALPAVQHNEDQSQIKKIRTQLFKHIETLMKMELPTHSAPSTIGDELTEIGQKALGNIKARIDKPRIDGEKVGAETMKLLAEVRQIHARTTSEIDRSNAEIESIKLDNLAKKIEIAEKTLVMLQRLEPTALESLSESFLEINP